MAVPATRHFTGIASEAPDPRAQRIRAVAPVARYPLIAEQRCANLALARAVPDSIMHPEHVDPTVDAGIAREQ